MSQEDLDYFRHMAIEDQRKLDALRAEVERLRAALKAIADNPYYPPSVRQEAREALLYADDLNGTK